MEIIALERENVRQNNHMRRIKTIAAVIDNTTPPTLSLRHLSTGAKKKQILKDRQFEIDNENRILMEKMLTIKSELKPQLPKQIIRRTNMIQRKRVTEKLSYENNRLVQRIENIQSVIRKDYIGDHESVIISYHNRHKKHLPFGIVSTTALARSTTSINSSATTTHSNLKESSILDYTNSSELGIQCVEDYRRVIVSLKREQKENTLSTCNSFPPAAPSNQRFVSSPNTLFQLTHEPEA